MDPEEFALDSDVSSDELVEKCHVELPMDFVRWSEHSAGCFEPVGRGFRLDSSSASCVACICSPGIPAYDKLWVSLPPEQKVISPHRLNSANVIPTVYWSPRCAYRVGAHRSFVAPSGTIPWMRSSDVWCDSMTFCSSLRLSTVSRMRHFLVEVGPYTRPPHTDGVAAAVAGLL